MLDHKGEEVTQIGRGVEVAQLARKRRQPKAIKPR